jgi:glucan phosphoethanolaminetransferase (alkaline phosphatase superfamily)
MESQTFYLLVADAILVTHVVFVVFVVLGLIFIFLGKLLSWRWVRNLWLRVTHLLGISVVVLQAWLGVICPLTTWEMSLRSKAGETIYEVSFISHWLSELLYYQASPWVFLVCYTVFGGLVLASWFLVRPRAFSKRF